MTPPANTRPPREAHKIDADALARWLGVEKVEVLQFKGGQSNPTYWVGAGDEAFVVRKKPPGKLLPSAHAVEREYRVMRALRDTDVPVPDAISLCTDEAVIGTPFFVMRWVPNRIFWDPTLPELASNDERKTFYADYVRVLAAMHRIDVERAGLGDFGKIGGFVARQVDRWSKQYEASRTSTIAPMEALMTWLRANVPASDETTLIHGDYRIDNLLVAPDAPRIIGVIDWELSTLGHPLSDLAYACLGYRFNLPGRGGLAGVDVGALGIPTEDEIVAQYKELTKRDRIEGFSFFMSFGIFRLAAIAQGVYARSLQGNASSDDAASYGAAVTMLSELGCSIAGVSF
ncbi:MAG: phosphotransferase family protein [Labilithrix sp.]|nr:phosphotransferase family protein [Labilithrix sp.]MCW5815299.1 phosphotransferase family protein [Labilithrix sp.]